MPAKRRTAIGKKKKITAKKTAKRLKAKAERLAALAAKRMRKPKKKNPKRRS